MDPNLHASEVPKKAQNARSPCKYIKNDPSRSAKIMVPGPFKNGHFWARTWRLQKCRKIANFQKKVVFLKFSRFLKTAIWPQTSLIK